MTKPKVKGVGKYTQVYRKPWQGRKKIFLNKYTVTTASNGYPQFPLFIPSNFSQHRGFFLKFKMDHVTLLLKTLQWHPTTSRSNTNSWVFFFQNSLHHLVPAHGLTALSSSQICSSQADPQTYLLPTLRAFSLAISSLWRYSSTWSSQSGCFLSFKNKFKCHFSEKPSE